MLWHLGNNRLKSYLSDTLGSWKQYVEAILSDTMGSTASMRRERDAHISSDEVRPCDQCKSDTNKVLFCDRCQKFLCVECCEHFAHRENPFYHSSPIPIHTENVRINSSKAIKKEIRCGIVAEHGKPVLLSKLFYQDKFCKCCDNTFKWKLCFLHDKPLYISKRQHSAEESFVFPGDICYVQTKRKLYMTLPCKQMVYKVAFGENFHEAFGTRLGGCFGITAFNNGLALSIRIPTAFLISKWQIQFVDFKGNVSRRIQNDDGGVAFFEEPFYLTSNKDESILFVSDHGKNSVLAFDVSGNLLFQYHGIALIAPLGLAADKYNNIYVACGKKILQIEKGGIRSKELLSFDTKDTIVSVCIDHNTDTLTTITEWGHVTSFNFEQ